MVGLKEGGKVLWLVQSDTVRMTQNVNLVSTTRMFEAGFSHLVDTKDSWYGTRLWRILFAKTPG